MPKTRNNKRGAVSADYSAIKRAVAGLFFLLINIGCEDGGAGVYDADARIDTDTTAGTNVEPECLYDVCDGTELDNSGLLPVFLSSSFSEPETLLIAHSMIDYNWAAGRSVFYIAGTTDVGTFTGPEALIIRSNADEGSVLARTYVQGIDYDSIYVYYQSMQSNVDWIHTIKHELVHLGEGLASTDEHTDDSADIMCVTYNRNLKVTHYSNTDIRIIRDSITRRFGGE